jgi:hypothetical protein
MLKAARSWIVASVLAAMATAYIISTKHAPEPPQPSSSSPPIEIHSAAPIANARVESVSPAQALAEPIPEPASNEERAAVIKQTMTEALAPSREVLVNGLVARGLAPEDSEQVAQRFVEGFADCLFEAARKDYEAQGLGIKEFLDGAEMVWTQTLAYVSLNRVQAAAVPCVANISQQTGIPLPANFGSGGSTSTEPISPPAPPPPWAADMEARIRDHIAAYPELGITSVLVECVENGCNVLMVGRGNIRVFDLEFDVFAEQNGFKHAVLFGDGNRRSVRLNR